MPLQSLTEVVAQGHPSPWGRHWMCGRYWHRLTWGVKITLIQDDLAQGIHEASKVLDQHSTHLCVPAFNYDESLGMQSIWWGPLVPSTKSTQLRFITTTRPMDRRLWKYWRGANAAEWLVRWLRRRIRQWKASKIASTVSKWKMCLNFKKERGCYWNKNTYTRNILTHKFTWQDFGICWWLHEM